MATQDVNSFKFWANKIIPLVYDDSLSYYEFLCKVMQKLNEVIGSVNDQNSTIKDMQDQIDAFIAAEQQAREDWELTETANRAAWELQQAQKMAAFELLFVSDYDSTKSYTAGKVCRHEGLLYAANGSTTGSWNSAKWDQIVLADYLANYVQTAAADMQSQYDGFLTDYQRQFGIVQNVLGESTTDAISQQGLRDTLDYIDNAVPLIFTAGGYIKTGVAGSTIADLTPTTLASYEYYIGPVSPGDVICYRGKISDPPSGYNVTILDENNVVLNSHRQPVTALDIRFIAPPGAAKIVLNSAIELTTAFATIGVTKQGSYIKSCVTAINGCRFKPYTADDFTNNSAIIPTTGAITNSNTRCRLTDYLSDNVSKITCLNNREISLFAYSKNDYSYVGNYDGIGVSPLSNTAFLTNVDLSWDLKNKYLFRLVIKKTSSETPADVLTDVNFYTTPDVATNQNATAIDSMQNDINTIETVLSSVTYPHYTADDNLSLISTSTGVWSAFDALVTAHPDYITKSALTSGSYTTYLYTLKTPNYNEQQGRRPEGAEVEKPKILLSSGVHGYERSAVMSVLHFVTDLCNGKQYLSEIKNSVELQILPIVCSWGYDNDTRWNANGVNINRNFDANWTAGGEPFDADYSGPSAASEDETKIVQAWLNSNSGAYYIDYHNSGFTNEVSYISSLANDNDLFTAYRQNINAISNYWSNAREIDQFDNIYEYTGIVSINGSSNKYATKINVENALLETSWNVGASGLHSAATIATGAEALKCLLDSVYKLS